MDMKKIYTVFLIVTLLCAGCSTVQYFSPKAIGQIEVGMSKEKVSGIFGQPHYRHINGPLEEWEYRYEDATKGGTDMLIVRFNSGVVESLDSFFKPNAPEVVPAPERPRPRPPHSR